MKTRKQIFELVRQLNPKQMGSDGPTSVLFASSGKKETLAITGYTDFIVVTAGKFPFRRRFRFRRDEV